MGFSRTEADHYTRLECVIANHTPGPSKGIKVRL
jgi:hypothetical protein